MKGAAILVVFLGYISTIQADCAVGAVPSLTNSSICYLYVNQVSAFTEAEINCIGAGGHLASVSDGFVNTFLAQHAKKAFNVTEFWVGGEDLGQKEHWFWLDGSDFKFTNWAPEEPVELPGFDCIGLSVVEGFWYTYDCFKEKAYVCQIPPVSS